MSINTFEKVTRFLTELELKGIHYSLAHNRDEAVMVIVPVPGERWEIEFFVNGSVEVERFASKGEIFGEEALAELFMRYSEDPHSESNPSAEIELVSAVKE